MRRAVVNHGAATAGDNVGELDHPVQVLDLVEHLNDNIVAKVAENLLILHRDFLKLIENVLWDKEGTRARKLLRSDLLRSLYFGLRRSATHHVMRLIHALQVREIRSQHHSTTR